MSNIQVSNPFAAKKAQASQNALAESTSAREMQEVQAMMVIAKKFPRDPIEAMDRILQACARPTLAEGALYSYSRGGAEVTGPSIRLAEAMAQAWGNIQFGIRELSQANGESTVEAFAWDIETNTRQVKVFQVPHSRYTRNGSKKLEDPRDIYELVANNGARRLRACILGVIPGDVQEAAVKQCESTLSSSADTSPEAIKRLTEAFAEYGVTVDMIQKRIQRRMDAILPAQVIQLRKIYASLRDGMSSPAEWFEGAAQPVVQPVDGESKTERLKRQAQASQKTTTVEFDADGFASRIAACTDLDTLDLMGDELREIEGSEDHERLVGLYRDRRAELAIG